MSKENQKLNREFKLSTVAVKNRTTVMLLTIMLTIFGVLSYFAMPKETFPEIIIPQIYIGAAYPGNSGIDMENLIARPIEKEINTINGLKKITSTNIQDFSTIIAEFNPDVDVQQALQDVKDAVDRAKSELPNDMPTDPDIFDMDFSEFPILFLNISGPYNSDKLKEYAEFLEDRIESIPEISKVDIRGLPEKEVWIEVNPYKMQSLEISFNDVENFLRAENVTISGGNLLVNGFRRSLRVDGEFKNLQEIESVVVKNENQKVVFLRDIATVSFRDEERKSFARLDTLPVITLDVIKRPGENIIAATDKINTIIDKAVATNFPSDLKLSITNDQSKFTRMMIANMENSIISGVILVVLVLLFFLGLRNALFVGLAIPLSMLLGFLILSIAGVTLNMIVLFSMILALGMLVDNGIVVIENIYRLLQEGKSPYQAAINGVGEVAWPIIASTATTLAAFLPLAFWSGLMGEFMKYLPVTLIIVLSSSLFIALVVNPMLASKYMKVDEVRTKINKRRLSIWIVSIVLFGVIGWISGIMAIRNIALIVLIILLFDAFALRKMAHWFQNIAIPKVETRYKSLIRKALNGRRPALLLMGTFLLLILSISLVVISQPKVDLFPNNEPQYINVFIDLPNGTDIATTNEFTEALERKIFKILEPNLDIVESVVAQVGEGTSDPNAGPSQGSSPNKARITITFLDFEFRKGKSTNDIREELRENTSMEPGASITLAKDNAGPPTGPPINLELTGDNIDTLIDYASRIQEVIDNSYVKGIAELKVDVQMNVPETLVEIDRKAAGRYGVSTGVIGENIRTSLFGKEIAKYKIGEDKYPIQLKLDGDYRYNEEVLLSQKITFRDPGTGKITQVPISSVASVKNGITYNAIKRKDLKRAVTLYSDVKDGYNGREIVGQIETLLAGYNLPEGYEIKFTGEQQEQEESGAFLIKAMLIAVFLIFLIIVSQFNSLATPFIIMFSVLFSTIGVFLGLVIFNMDFIIIMTGIGIISLAGVVVNNAIVLIDYINLTRKRMQKDGEPLSEERVKEAIISGGVTRLRPVLLTAITTVLGLIPLAIGMNIDFPGLITNLDPNIYIGGDNAIMWGPMAWTVIFGLIFATFLTLVIVPVMYLLAEKLKWKLKPSSRRA